MYAQHADCVPKSKALPYSHSNTFINKFFNLTMFNIGYHIEHHDHPMTHWSDLPSLHAQMKPELVAAGAHVVPYGYYRSGQLLCRATFNPADAERWRFQHPDYRRDPSDARHTPPAPPVAAPSAAR
jgi:fatty acid desaturase